MNKIFRKKNSFSELFMAFCSGAVIVGVLWLWYGSDPSDEFSPGASSQQDGSSVVTSLDANGNLTQQTLHISQQPVVVSQEPGSVLSRGRVVYKIDRFKKLALQPLEFDIFDENKKLLTPEDLKIVNEQRVHFIVVSSDLKEYQHLNPDFSDGKWKLLAYLPTPGTYYAYVDIAPVNGKPVVLRNDLVVRDPSQTPIPYPVVTPPESDGHLPIRTDDYLAKLNIHRPNLLQQTFFSYRLFSSTSDSDVSPETFLGAFGHMVIFRHGDPDSFRHLHAVSSSNVQKNPAEFITSFGKSGKYTAFAEFKISGKVFTFPVTFEIQ